MIKKVLYDTNLISVGNAPVYTGKPVWSDGRIVYGWNYMSQRKTRSEMNYTGFWVNDVVQNLYRLAGKNLLLGRKIPGAGLNFGQYCLPVGLALTAPYAYNVRNYDGSISYSINGIIVSVSPDGRVMTWDGVLKQYANDGTYVSTAVRAYPCFDRFRGNYVHLGGTYYSTVDAVTVADNSLNSNARRLLQLATADNVRVFRAIASCVIDNVVVANTDTSMDVTLDNIAGVTLSSNDVLFYSGGSYVNTVTLNASGQVLVRAAAAGTGVITATYTYGTYTVTGAIPIVITTSPYLSERGLYTLTESKLASGVVTDEAYPQYYDLSQDIRIRLSDMALQVGNYTYTGDVLDILAYSPVCPAAVHCYRVADAQDVTVGAYISSQDTRKLHYFDINGTSAFKEYAGLQRCWSLAWVKEKIQFI